jgi:flagellar L-ring protein precursor FlgH
MAAAFKPSALCAALALCGLMAGCQSPYPAPKVDFVEPVSARPAVKAVVSAPVNGSLFSSAHYRPAFEDRRARMVGDSLTIQIVENVSASQKSTSSIDRSGSNSAGISAFPFVNPALLGKTALGTTSANTFAGKGGTESANTFSGTITASVVEVLPNGYLQITGEKQIGVNQNVDVLRFSGTVDPRAIQAGNTIDSTQVANARIQSRGRGTQDEAQSIGWLSRVFLNVLPF